MSEETRAAYRAAIDAVDAKIDALRAQIDDLELERSSIRMSDEDRQWQRDQLSPGMRRFVEMTEKTTKAWVKMLPEIFADTAFIQGDQWSKELFKEGAKIGAPLRIKLTE